MARLTAGTKGEKPLECFNSLKHTTYVLHALIFFTFQTIPSIHVQRTQIDRLCVKKQHLNSHSKIQLKLFDSEAAPNPTLLEKHRQLKWCVSKMQVSTSSTWTKTNKRKMKFHIASYSRRHARETTKRVFQVIILILSLGKLVYQ